MTATDAGAANRRVELPSPEDLAAARRLVADHLPPTPVVPVRLPRVEGLDGFDGEVLLKLETMQPTGSFKVRGALVALAAYGNRPVVTASAGNHGLGVAFAAQRLGVQATVVVPTTASAAKVEALRRMDVELVLHGDDYEASERHALGLAERGAVFVSPYNDRHVIAGQSTVAAELVDQVGRDVTLVVPVGGGGLIAGIALGLGSDAGDAGDPGGSATGATRVVGVEAAASAAVSSAVEAGYIAPVPIGRTLADGLGGNLEPGAVTPDGARGRVHGFVQVDEDGIAGAIRVLATRCGLVAEGAAAVGVAALLSGAVPLAGPPVVVLTGRNIAPDLLARLLEGGGVAGNVVGNGAAT
jgi:threonine dehydratase